MLTCIWLPEHFIAVSHIYPGFLGKLSTLTHFPLKLGCEDYSFLDQTVKDFKHGLDIILMDFVDTPKLDASFGEADPMPSSVSLGILHLVSTISDTSRPQLTPSIKSHK